MSARCSKCREPVDQCSCGYCRKPDPVVAAAYAAAPGVAGLDIGVKFDQDKPRMDLLDPHAMDQLAKVLTFGAQKYAAHNWRKGLHKSRLIGAALRHLFAYLKGENTDPETGLSHAAHAMCCCMFILGLEHREDLDDRFTTAPRSDPPAPGSTAP